MIITQTAGEDTQSMIMSLILDAKFQCANTTCLPVTNVITSNIRNCQVACLTQSQCIAATFHRSTSNCELFDNMLNQNGNILADVDATSMNIVSGTRFPPVFTGDCILISKIDNNILIGNISESLWDVTQNQCICQMINSNETISTLNYFSTNQTCQLFYTNFTSILIEFNLSSSLIFMNQSAIFIAQKSTTTSTSTTSSTTTAIQREYYIK
ncbi:unnamed protein product [Adineta steineri]|nr:unnamed protein product [Adineta steineri]